MSNNVYSRYSLAVIGVCVIGGCASLVFPRVVWGHENTEVSQVSFSRDVAPILRNRCLACHGDKNFEGEYQVVHYEALFIPGAAGEAPISPGNADESYLLQLVLEDDDDLRMPMNKDALSASQVEILRRWIEEGASFDGSDPRQQLVDLIPPQRHPDSPVIYRVPPPVTAIAISGDGQRLAVGGFHEITLWNLVSGELERRMGNVAERTYGLVFTADNGNIVAASGTPGEIGEVRVFDVVSGQLSKELFRTDRCALGVALDATGNRLAVGGADHSVRILDLKSGMQLVHAQHHSDWVYSVAFSGNGAQLVSVSRDKTAKIVDASTGDLITTYAGHKKAVYDARFIANDAQVVSCSEDGSVHVWKTKGSGKASGMSETPTDEKTVKMIGAGTHPFHSIAVTAKSILTCSGDGTVSRFSKDGWNHMGSYLGHSQPVYCVAFNESTGHFASGDYGGKVSVWDARGERISTFIAAPGYQSDGR